MAKASSSAKGKTGSKVLPDIVTLVRAAVSVLLLILTLSVSSSQLISVLLIAAAIVVSGFDIALSAADRIIRKRDYLNAQCLILICVIACLCIGCYKETVIMLAVYQVCSAALNYAIKRTRLGFLNAVCSDDTDGYLKLRSILNSPAAAENPIMSMFLPYFDLFSKAAFIVGILFAVFVPMLTNMTYVMSIRRASMLIAASVPTVALASLPVCSLAGLSRCAEYGVFMKRSEVLNDTRDLAVAIFDKTDVFTDGTPKLVSLNSPVLGSEDFLKLAAYTAYRSQQRFAAPIVSAYSGDIVQSYITDFRDIPGCGMEISLSGRAVLLGTQELFEARNIEIPETERRDGYVLYLSISGVYVGSMLLKENINPYAESTVSDLHALGDIKCVLLTEDGSEISEKLAKSLNIDELHCECDFSEKASIIQKYKDQLEQGKTLMYISADNLEYHTAADIDAKVGTSFGNADIVMSNVGLFGLPVALTAAQRVRQLSIENLIFTAFIKLVLIVLALTGSATLWFIVLVDFAASMAGVLNIVRLPTDPHEEQMQ